MEHERRLDIDALPNRKLDLQTMEWLAEQMPGGFFIYRADESQELLFANSAVLGSFGCETLEEFKALTGYTFRGLVHPDDFPAIQKSIDEQIADSANASLDYVEYRILQKDGNIRWIDDYGHRVSLPDYGDVYFVFISDITERRREKEEKLRVQMELEREKRVNEIKSDFLFHVSHDIRTPMNAIMGFSDLAQRHINEPERLQDYLDKVKESGRQMMALLDDLLEMSRLEHGRIEIKTEPCELAEQISMAIDLFRAQIEEKHLTLVERFELPEGKVFLDANRFRRVMGNLISNAVKFTPPNGTVTISACQKQTSESGYARYEFTVSDTGIGMTEEFMRRMYAAFEREESSTKAGTIGTGLGLSIAKKLIDIMGGSISVTSKKGEGSAFTMDLPLKLAGCGSECLKAKHGEETPYKDAGEHRILLVEDIEINRMLAETILEEAGFGVESVPDGCDAVEAITKHPAWYYDLVLMDIQMPVMNGYEAARAIRAIDREDTKAIPIIALSANARDEDKRMSIESGMNSHIAKPFDIAQLIGAVNEHIAAREQ